MKMISLGRVTRETKGISPYINGVVPDGFVNSRGQQCFVEKGPAGLYDAECDFISE